MDRVPEFVKKLYAAITGGIYESPAPLTGDIGQSARYAGDKPCRFQVRGGEGGAVSILTGDAPDYVTAARGSHLEISTGGGNDTVRAGMGDEALGQSTVDLGAGNDLYVPGYQLFKPSERNRIYGGDGVDAIELRPDAPFEMRAMDSLPNPGIDLALTASDGEIRHEILYDFERLNITNGGKGYVFSLDDITALKTTADDVYRKQLSFDAASGQLKVAYGETGNIHAAVSPLKVCEAADIAAPGQTPQCLTTGEPQTER